MQIVSVSIFCCAMLCWWEPCAVSRWFWVDQSQIRCGYNAAICRIWAPVQTAPDSVWNQFVWYAVTLCRETLMLSAALGKTGSKVETCTIMCFIFPVVKAMFMWPQFAIICRVLPKNVCLPSWLAVAYEHHRNHNFFSFPNRRKPLCYAVFCRLLCGFFIFDTIGANQQFGAKQGKLRTPLVVKS